MLWCTIVLIIKPCLLTLSVGELNGTYVKNMLASLPFYDDGRQEALILHVKLELFDLCMRELNIIRYFCCRSDWRRVKITVQVALHIHTQ